ncbi:MAG TPA: PorT family protein [Bacteroidetes bacterium]|nr:PorT family protein [Bacteroidota bacterium]
MQDNKTHIDNKTTELAWQEMKKILDQEMPSEKHNRRPLFWWYAAGIGLAAGIAAIWLVNFTPVENTGKTDIAITETNNSLPRINPGKNNNTETDKSLIAGNNPSRTDFVKKEKPNTSKNNILNKKDNSSIAENTSPSDYLKNTKGETTSKNNILNKKENNKKGGVQVNNFATIENINSENKELNILGFPQKTIAGKDLKTSNAAGNNIPEKEIQNINKAADGNIPKIKNTAEIASLPIAEIAPPTGKCPAVPVSKINPENIELLVYAAHSFPEINKSGGGIGTGLLASIPLGKSRLSLEAGLGYSYISQPLSYISSISESANIYEPGTLEYNELNDQLLTEIANATYDTNDPLPSALTVEALRPLGNLQLHYLQVPVTLSYRFKRFRFFGGLQAGVLLKGKNRSFRGGIFGNAGLKSADERVANTSALAQQFYPISPLSNFEMAANVGLGYDFSKRFGANLSYSTGLSDVIVSNEKKDYNRFYQFTLRYKIGSGN